MPDPSLHRACPATRLGPPTPLGLLCPAAREEADWPGKEPRPAPATALVCDTSPCDTVLCPHGSLSPAPAPCSPVSCRHSYYDCCVSVAASKLLEHWLDAPSPAGSPRPAPSLLSSLLDRPDPLPALRTALAGQPGNPLHVLLTQHPGLPALPALVRLLVAARPSDTLLTDGHGDSALTMVRHLLEAGQMARAREVAALLLAHGADPRHKNMCGWSLLAYSLSHQDAALQLTRDLLGRGAPVLPPAAAPPVASAPFRVLLSSVVRRQSLAGAGETLVLLGQAMARAPARMKAHVLGSLQAEARYPSLRTLALFREVRATLAPHWARPASLLHLSLHASRRRLKRLGAGAAPVPPRLASYLSFRLSPPPPRPPPPPPCPLGPPPSEKTEPAQYPEDLLTGAIRRQLATAS